MEKKLTLPWLLSMTSLALLFLSANSILAKAALVNNFIDAYSFTFFRIISGTITLLVLIYFKQKTLKLSMNKNWITSFMLFLYAITFSYAYLDLEAGLGTLLLFGVVQLSMIFIAVFKKESINLQKIFGIVVAFTGLIYLLYPTEEFSLSFFHSFLMIVAGTAWAVYTVLGKSSKDALFNTYDNFVKASIFVVLFYVLFIDTVFITTQGVVLAVVSGSLTSAIGYAIWYVVLPQLQIVTASIIQLIVPIIAIFLSVLFLGEQLTSTLVISTVIILSGIIISTLKRKVNN